MANTYQTGTDDKKKRRANCYWVGDKPFISVTEILKVIDKPAIRYWFGQQVFYAMAKDPSLDEKAALASPYQTSKDSASRGSTVHAIIEGYKTGGIQVESLPLEFRGYASAFQMWANEVKLNVIENEKTIVNEEFGYAGTMDMIADIGGRRYVIDFKTSKDGTVYTEAHMQVSAYQRCVPGVDGGVIVGLSPEGKYNHVQAKDGFKPFLNALELYKFINQDKLLKLGYL